MQGDCREQEVRGGLGLWACLTVTIIMARWRGIPHSVEHLPYFFQSTQAISFIVSHSLLSCIGAKMVLISNHSYCSAGTFGGFFFIPTSSTQCSVLKMMFVLLQVSQVNEIEWQFLMETVPSFVLLTCLAMLLSCQMINDHLVGMENNLEFFSDFHSKNQLDQPCNCIPYWAVMFFLWS